MDVRSKQNLKTMAFPVGLFLAMLAAAGIGVFAALI
jgi:hypothetical protein